FAPQQSSPSQNRNARLTARTGRFFLLRPSARSGGCKTTEPRRRLSEDANEPHRCLRCCLRPFTEKLADARASCLTTTADSYGMTAAAGTRIWKDFLKIPFVGGDHVCRSLIA